MLLFFQDATFCIQFFIAMLKQYDFFQIINAWFSCSPTPISVHFKAIFSNQMCDMHDQWKLTRFLDPWCIFEGPGKGTEYNHWVNWEWFEIGNVGRNHSQSLFFKQSSLIINSSLSGISSNLVKCVTFPFLARDAKCLGSFFSGSEHKGKPVLDTSSKSIIDL